MIGDGWIPHHRLGRKKGTGFQLGRALDSSWDFFLGGVWPFFFFNGWSYLVRDTSVRKGS